MAPEQPVPRFFLFLMIAAAVLMILVLRPIFTELFVAVVLAGVLWPSQQWLCRKVRGRRNLAAGLMTAAVLVLLVGPIAAIATFVVRDGSEGVRFVSDALQSEEVADLVEALPESARQPVRDAIGQLPRDLGDLVSVFEGRQGEAAKAVGAAVKATSSFAFHTVMMFIALFFLLVGGDRFVAWLDTVSPLPRGHTHELLTTFKRVTIAVVVSAVVTSGVQAVAALVGYLIAGVPNPLFFGLVTFLVAFIPAVGAAVVCLVAAALLLVTGHPYMALFLAIWGIVVVGLVDNLVKPLLIRRGLEIHGGIVFFSLIGGLAAFGAIGLIVGPLAVAFFLALLRIYHREYTPGDHRVPKVPGLPGETPA
jgi:predicted PurR-regulated permease PerM